MLYAEINAVCSQINTKHINTLCGQNVELRMLNWRYIKWPLGFKALMSSPSIILKVLNIIHKTSHKDILSRDGNWKPQT